MTTEHDDQQDAPEEGQPMTAQTTQLPVPPPPTPEEQAERERKWREERDREEAERAAAYEARHEDAVKGAKDALARLIAMETERASKPPEEREVKGIPGVDYYFPDLTEDRVKHARKAWNVDLEKVRDEEDEERSLTSWRIDHIEDQVARSLIGRYVAQLPNGPKRNLIMVGSVGAGKTASALAAGHAAVERGILTRYVSHNDYLARLRPGGARNGLTAEQYKDLLRTCQLLVLDDLCADMPVDAPASEFARRETMELLNYRLHKRKPVIVTTNLTTEQVSTVIDQRLASRLGMDAVVVTMVQKDRRKPEVW